MQRYAFIFLIAFLYACQQDNKSKPKNQQEKNKQVMNDTASNEYKLTARFNSFDTTVEVLFWDTKDSISEIQKKNYDGFIEKQDFLTPEIMRVIFDFYKSSYNYYKEGAAMAGAISDEELEKHLPVPTTPENLKEFITPAIVHIQRKEDCEEGTIGIEFDCTWDIEHGLGVTIKNWKVKQASVAEIVYY